MWQTIGTSYRDEERGGKHQHRSKPAPSMNGSHSSITWPGISALMTKGEGRKREGRGGEERRAEEQGGERRKRRARGRGEGTRKG